MNKIYLHRMSLYYLYIYRFRRYRIFEVFWPVKIRPYIVCIEHL